MKINKLAILQLVALVVGVGGIIGCSGGGDKEKENILPTVSAGNDITVAETENVAILASAQDSDGSIASTQWTQASGTTVEFDASLMELSFVAPDVDADEILTFNFKATDDKGGETEDSVSVTVIDFGDYKLHSQTVSFNNGEALNLFSLSLKSLNLSDDDIEFNLLTHLQYLHAMNGTLPDESDVLLRQYFKVFDGSILALASVQWHQDINQKLSDLSAHLEITIKDLIPTIFTETSRSYEGGYRYRDSLAAQIELTLSKSTFVISDSVDMPVFASLDIASQLSPAIAIAWVIPDNWTLTETESGVAITPVAGPSNSVTANIIDSATQAVLLSVSQEIQVNEIVVASPRFNEEDSTYKLLKGVSADATDFDLIKDSWIPSFDVQPDSLELVRFSVGSITQPTQFIYNYDPIITANPKLLNIVVDSLSSQQVITPDSIDYDAHKVYFTYPGAGISSKGIKPLTQQLANTDIQLYIDIVSGRPTGDDIDELLKGNHDVLLESIYFYQPSDNYEQIKAQWVEPLYSENDAIRRVSRAKLTAALQFKNKSSGKYSRYEMFVKAINMATADKTIKQLNQNSVGATATNWYQGNDDYQKWLKNCPLVGGGFVCESQLASAQFPVYALNQGLKSFYAYGDLTTLQQGSINLFKLASALTNFSYQKRYSTEPKFGGDDIPELVAGLQLDFVAPESYSYLFDAATGLKDVVKGTAGVPIVALGIAFSYGTNRAVDLMTDSFTRKNVVANTPLFYALRNNKEHLFDKYHTQLEGVYPWTRNEFLNEFFPVADKVYYQIIAGGTPSPNFLFGWNSQFSSHFDPTRRMESLLLGDYEADGWTREYPVSIYDRLIAYSYLGAAFGDEALARDIEAVKRMMLITAVTPWLYTAYNIDTNVVAYGTTKYSTSAIKLKSQFNGENAFICHALVFSNGTYQCRQQNKKQVNRLQAQQNKQYINQFNNFDSQASLIDGYGFKLTEALYKELQDGSLSLENIKVKVSGYHLIYPDPTDGDTTLGEKIPEELFELGRLQASHLVLDETTGFYTASLKQLVPEIENSHLDDALLAVYFEGKIKRDGKTWIDSHAEAFTTAPDNYIGDVEAPMTDVSGTVADADGVTVEGVALYLSPVNKTIDSDSEGRFVFSKVTPGTYSLKALSDNLTITLGPIELPEVKVEIEDTAIPDEPPVETAGKLNDTGITTCSDNSTNGLTCPVTGFEGQDAEHGRDATHNDDSDGHAGFSFTKLDSNGNPLAASATEWSCVKDNVTGLIWEVKTLDGGIHDANTTYRWGGKGADPFGTEFYSDWDVLVDGSNNESLCGFKDWRVPRVKELEGLVNFDRTSPAIDSNYFPNSSSHFWSASAYAYYSDGAWNVVFGYGYSYNNDRYNGQQVRLVRGGQ
jgi:hypothetical protein